MVFQLPTRNLLVFGSPSMSASCDAAAALDVALDAPIQAAPIAQALCGKKHVAIISDDYTRPTPVALLMPRLLARLNEAGIHDSDIVIVIASGIHRRMTEEELLTKLGAEAMARIRIVQHRADNEEMLVFVGTTKSGTPIWLNREVIEADFRIGIGFVEAHPYAGFSGGAKIMMPGVAGQETIFHHHGHMAKSPDSWFGRTTGNPFWEDLVEVAELGRLDMVVNTVLSSCGGLASVFAGEPVATQERAIEVFVKMYGVEVPEPADIVIASANPKYWYFDQSNVAMLNASNIVKDGGTRIIVAHCPENLGNPTIRRLYMESFGRPWPTPAQYLEEMAAGLYDYEMADAPAIYKLLQAEEKAHMILVSDEIDAADANAMRLDWTRDFQKALDRALTRHGADAKVVVLPFGGMSYPYLREDGL